MTETNPLLEKVLGQPTYKSRLHISLAAWTLSLSLFHYGYFLVYVTQIPTSTVKDLYGIDMQDGLTEGILNGCVPVGALCGALSSSLFINRFSRRNNMLFTNAVCFVVGCLLFVQNFPMILMCRFLQGICMGLFTSFTPMFIRQLAPTQISGALCSYTEVHIAIGTTVACFFPYCLLKITGDSTGRAYWYYVFALPQVVILVQVALLLFVFPYDTVKYWLSVGNHEEARKLVEIIYKPEYVDEVLEEKKVDLKRTELQLDTDKINESQEIKSGKPKSQVALFMALHLAAFQQLSGVNMVSIYSVSFASQVTTGELALAMPSLINAFDVIGTIGSMFLLQRIGRRTALVNGAIVITIANAIILTGFFIKGSAFGEGVLLAGVFIFIVDFGLTVGPAMWLYIPEIIQPSKIPYSVTSSWLSGSVIVILFPILTKDYLNNDPKYLFIFTTVWSFASAVINYFFLLETKDKTEKEIRDAYKNLSICKVQANQE